MVGQVIIITGAGRGIGRAASIRFAREHGCIVAVARHRDQLEETRAAVLAAGGACEIVAADVARPESSREVVERALRRFEHVDVLVNCAGVAPLTAFEAFSQEDYDAVRGVNMDGVYQFCRAVWPVFKRQRSGLIINVSSVSAVDPFPGLSVYGASKAWVNALTRGLAQEGREHGIRAYAVAPGAVETEMLRAIFPDYPPEQCLKPEEVAEAIYGMTLPGMTHASGQTVLVTKT